MSPLPTANQCVSVSMVTWNFEVSDSNAVLLASTVVAEVLRQSFMVYWQTWKEQR